MGQEVVYQKNEYGPQEIIGKLIDEGLGMPVFLGRSCCDESLMRLFRGREEYLQVQLNEIDTDSDRIFVVSHFISKNRLEYLKLTFNAISERIFIVAFGNCPIFPVFPVTDDLIDLSNEFAVDFFLPGCPPQEQALIDCFNAILTTVENEKRKDL